MNTRIWSFLISVLEVKWNIWICKMIDYLKGSIGKVKFNFEMP